MHPEDAFREHPMTLPVAFISHGSPMLALDQGEWSQALRGWAAALPEPGAILVLSAHWEQAGPLRVSSAPEPGTLHDFGGFPAALYRLQYPAPGDPGRADRIVERLRQGGLEVETDANRPLDHGAWVPLLKAFPDARIPVLQISLPVSRTQHSLFELGHTLAPLREEGVLLIASGGLVHNLGRLQWEGDPEPEDWARRFEAWVEEGVASGDLPRLLEAERLAPGFAEAVPTREHFDPLYFALGAAGASSPSELYRGWQLGNLSLRAWSWG